jgi:hypothetical protein
MTDIQSEMTLEGGGKDVLIADEGHIQRTLNPIRAGATVNQNITLDQTSRQAADNLSLSQKTGWSLPMVQAQKEEAVRHTKKMDFAAIDEAALLGFIAKSPENAAIANDEIPRLRKIVREVGKIQSYFGKLGEDVSKAVQTGEARLSLVPLYKRKFFLGEKNPELEDEIKRLEDSAQEVERKDLFGEVATTTAEQFPLFKQSIKGGLESVIKGLPVPLALGTIVGPAAIPGILGGAAGLFAFGAAEEIFELEAVFAAKEYSEFRDEEGNPLDPEIVKYAALTAGYLNAGIEFASDAGIAKLFSKIPGFDKLTKLGARKAIKTALRQKAFRTALQRIAAASAGTVAINAIEEGAQELVTILSGEAAKELSKEEFEMLDPKPALKRIFEAGRKGALGGLGFATATSSVSVGVAAMNQAIRLQRAKSVKERPKQFYQDQLDVSEALEDTIIKTSAPSKAKELLENSGMTQDVLVDGKEAQDFYQTEDNSAIFAKLGITEQKVNEAAASGQSIPIELSEIHAALSLEESEQFFRIVKETSESLSLKDSQTINISEELKIIQENIEETNRDNDTFQREKDRIEKEIFNAAKIRKIVRPTQTEAYAKAVTELMGAFAERMSVEGDQTAAETLGKISAEVANFKDIKSAQEFIGANDLKNVIPLGVTKIHPEGFIIKLFEDANPSTLLHETGHVFFNEVLSLVNMGKASEKLVEDFNIVKEWMKVDPNEGITLRQQDKFARGFELYLREGKAPSAGLTPFFERFKKWLLTVYEKIKGTPIDIDLNDDVRGVFDRLLTVELQTEEFVAENEFVTSEQVMEQIGLSEEEKLLFRRLMKGMTATAKKELQQRLAREHKKNIKEWTREAEIEVTGRRVNNLFSDLTSSRRGFNLASSAQFLSAKELNDLIGKFPDVFNEEGMDPKIVSERFGFESVKKMFDSLTRPLPSREVNEGAFNKSNNLRTFLGKPILGLDQQEIEFQFGKQTAVRLKAKNARLVRKDGQNPQEVALEYGYDSMSEMVKALEIRLPRKEQVANVVNQKEKAHYINFTSEDAFLNWNDDLAKFFKTMGDFLARKAGVEVEGLRQKFKEEAEKEFSSESVRRASRTDWYLSALRKNMRERDKAVRKGDFKEATKFHERARLSYEFARKSNRVKNDRRDLKNLAKRAGKDKGKIEFDYWKNIVSLANKYNLRSAKEPQNVVPFQNLLDAQKSLLDAGVTFGNWIEAERPTNFLDLSVARFTELKTLLEVLDFYGRKIISDDTVLSNMKFAELKQGLLERAAANPRKIDVDADSVLGKLDRWSKDFYADLNTLFPILRALDGFTELGPKRKTGPWVRTIFDEGAKADSEYLRINDEILDRIKPALNQLTKSIHANPKELTQIKVSVPEVLKLHNRRWHFDTVLSVAFNMGNRGNIDALKQGYNLSEADLIEITSILNKEDWKAIQLIGNVIGSYREQLFAVKKRLTRFEPTAVEPNNSLLPPGLGLRGWYWPLKKDLTLTPHSLGLNFQESFNDTQVSAVADGPLQERKGFGGNPVKLNLSTLAQHINFIALYISHAEYMKDVGRLFADPELSNIVVEKVGLSALNSMKASLNNMAQSKHEHLLTLDRMFEKIRRLSTAYILGLKFKVALKQTLSTPIFWSEYGADAWFNGVWQIMKATLTLDIGRVLNNINTLSPFMKNRGSFIDVSLTEAIKQDLFEKPIKFAFGVKKSDVANAVFILIKTADFVTVLPQWLGALEKGKKEFQGDMDQAVVFADKAIRTTQPSFRPIDLSPLQSSRKGMSRAVTMFSTATLIIGRQQRTLLAALKRGQITIPAFIRATMIEASLAPLMMVFGFAALKGALPEEKELLIELFIYQLIGLPLVKDFAFTAGQLTKGKRFGKNFDSPLFTPFELGNQLMDRIIRFIKDLDDDKKWKQAVMAFAELLGFSTGIPATRVQRDIIKGMESIERGDSTPTKIFKVLVPQPEPKKKKKK